MSKAEETATEPTGNAQALGISRGMHALGRLGEPEDIASGIVGLLDPRNSWIRGEVLRVDSGLAHLRPTVRQR